MTIGDTTLPSKIPNLNQILFNGYKIDEFNRPKIKKIIAIITAQILISSFLSNGNIDIIKKNKKKTTPKLLFDEILIFLELINLIKDYLAKFNILYFQNIKIYSIFYSTCLNKMTYCKTATLNNINKH